MIHGPVQLGDDCRVPGVTIWPFASVIRGSRLGAGTQVASCAIVDGAVVGRDCRIGHGAQIHPGSVLGDRVFIGPGVVLANDRWPSVDKANWTLPPSPTSFGEAFATVVIADDAAIGANAVILPGVRIGRRALVAAGAVVTSEVPDGYLWHRLGGGCKPILEEKRQDRARLVAVC